MLQKIEAAIEGISAAIEKGMTRRTKSEQEVEARKQTLAETAAKLGRISTRLTMILEKVGGRHV
jgi:phage-related protein